MVIWPEPRHRSASGHQGIRASKRALCDQPEQPLSQAEQRRRVLLASPAAMSIAKLARYGLQQLIELEASAVVDANRHERSEEWTYYRNDHRPRSLTTQVGDLAPVIPKLRSSSVLPSLLASRRRVEQTPDAVIMDDHIGGVSTPNVDALVAVLGSQSGISKPQVSRLCQEIDQQVQAFLSRPLESSGDASISLNATDLKGRAIR